MSHVSLFESTTTICRTRSRAPICLRLVSSVLFLLVCVLSASPLYSQQVDRNAGKKVQPSATATINIQEIERREKESKQPPERKEVENEKIQIPRELPILPGAKGETFKVILPPNTSAIQARKKDSSTLLEPLFPAIGDNDTTIPPDLGGAVGPNHVMTALNSQVRIQDKTGAIISTVTLNNFFAPLIGAARVFDPKVLYDPFAGRWIITAPANSRNRGLGLGVIAPSALLIAISSTNDPTNPWTGYSFQVDSTFNAALPNNSNWFDYPSIGFNNNWIVLTGNLFQSGTGAFMGAQIYIFDKAALYVGPSVPTVLNRPTADGFTICPAITLDNSMSTEYLVSNWNGNFGGNGFLRIYTITGTPAAPVYTPTALQPNVAQPWASSPNAMGADFAPQSGAPQLIQNNDSRMQNVVFRNGSVWCAQSAFLPAAAPTHTAVQWWQFDPTTATVQQFGRVDDATATNFYAFPSIGVNAYSDVLLGYSSFSAAQFASANYSFRLRTDPPNTMQPTVIFRAGLAKYFKNFAAFGGVLNRWGDYSSTCIDPDDFSMWTLQEYAELPGVDDMWGTEWNRVVPPVPNLYVKDVPADTGAEPDPSTQAMYESDDIWLRQTQDSAHAFAHITQNGEYHIGTANPNYVYVDVRNRGGAPSAGTEQLTLYWAKAGSGLSWPDPWNGGVYFDPGPNTMLMGGVIGTVPLPAIAAGAQDIVEFAWNPPDPSLYMAAFGADTNHFCLLARVTTSAVAPFGMTFPEQVGDLYGNVQKNNHIAWKNIGVYDAVVGNAPVQGVMANLGLQKMIAKLKFTAIDTEGNPVLLNKGILKVTPGAKLKAILRDHRLNGDGMKDGGDGSFQIVKDGGTLENIPLDPKEWGTLDILYVPNNAAEGLKGYAIRIAQIDTTTGTDRIVGGQTFVFGQVKGFGTSSGGGTAHWHWLLLLLIILLIILVFLWWLRKKK
jgi:hypothetical protein